MKMKLGVPAFEKLAVFLKQYKLVLILIAVGLMLLAFPQHNETTKKQISMGLPEEEESFSLEDLEKKLSEILSQIEGAGEVSVMLTIRSGMERILATDRELSEHEYEREMQEKTVVISDGSGEGVVLIGQNYPIFQGALVVCQGGEDPTVRLQLTEAVSALTGLNTNRITVCKGP